MTVTLPGGGNVLLADAAPGVEQVRVCLGWHDEPSLAGVDLDGVVILIDAPGEGTNGPTSARMLLADQVPNPTERLGGPPPPRPLPGDAERHVVTLGAVPAALSRLQFGAAIYDAAGRGQTFRPVHGLYLHVLNHADGVEIARCSFEAETGLETAMIFGEIYRHPRGWKFRAVGQGRADGLPGLAHAAAGATDTHVDANGANGAGRDIAAARPRDVADFLTRTSPSRTRRNLAEHLHPPRASTPPAAPLALTRPTPI
ncbi:TerD family protein, partial [Frankia sp. AgKG'84/4]